MYDVAIVGAGPIGIELAVALKQAQISVVHFDAGQIGSTIEWYAPGTTFFSSPERIAICGIPLEVAYQLKATREDYLRYLRGVVRQFALKIRTYEKITAILGENNCFKLRSAVAETCARKVVLAIGDMHQPRLLGIPGENLSHVSHYLKDPHTYFAKKVLIVGAKNSAAEAAIRLFRVGCEVTLSYHGAEINFDKIKMWIAPELRNLIASGDINCLCNSRLQKITERKAFLLVDGKKQVHEFDFILLLSGYCQDSLLFERCGIQLSGPHKAPSFDPHTMETNIPGIFVAGTACAGSQIATHSHFIETSHVHVPKIVAAITGSSGNLNEKRYLQPEI